MLHFPPNYFFLSRKSGMKHQQTLTMTGFSNVTHRTQNVTSV